MNASKTNSLLVAMACGLCVTAAVAADEFVPEPALTRAEVLADLEVWQLAGMPAFVQGDTLNADIEMILMGRGGPEGPGAVFSIGNLTVRTTLERGQFVVVGENAVQSGGLEGPVFYIVYWPANE